jgi:hypothetical protein
MLSDVGGVALLCAGAGAVAFVHLRHFGLLGLVVLGPVPGLAAVAAGWRLLMEAPRGPAPLAWLFGFAAAYVLTDEIVVSILDGAKARDAVRAAFRSHGLALGGAVLAWLGALLALVIIPGEAWPAGAAAIEALAAIGSALAVVPLAALFRYGEDFIARRNRTAERWHRLFAGLIAVARPRWGFAVSGIVLVFLVLGVFGAQSLALSADIQPRAAPACAVAGLIVAVALVAAIRDWRVIVPVLLTVGLAVLIGLWGFARLAEPFDGARWIELCLALGAGSVAVFAAGSRAGRYARTGDDATIVAGRLLARSGPGLFFTGVAVVTALLVWSGGAGWHGLALAAAAAFAGAGPLLFQPALAAVVESWFPRPATVAARYRLQ